MSLRKTASRETPHAVYTAGEWTWSVLKVNRPQKMLGDPFNSWFCIVVTPMTGKSGDMGDTYVEDVLRYATLASSTPEFDAYLKEKG